MRAAPADVADQGPGGTASGRPASHFRDHPRVTEWLSVARCTACLWAIQDVVQSVRALGSEGGLGAGLHGSGRGGRAARGADVGCDARQGASVSGGGKRGAQQQAIAGTPRSGRIWWRR